MANPESGKYGTITKDGSELQPVTNWELTIDPNLDEYASNEDGGWYDNVDGTHRGTGSFQMVEKPTFEEGSTCALVLYSQDQYTYTFDARIGTISHTEDIEAGTVGRWDVAYRARGAINKSTGSYT